MVFDISQIKVIVGLGNFEPRYAHTRHNAGYMLVDLLRRNFSGGQWKENGKLEAQICQIQVPTAEAEFTQILLVKPTTGMNISGRAVQKVMNYYRLEPAELLLAYDDLDLRLGAYKLQFNKFPKVHNGVNSVMQHLANAKFWHLRLGIDNREIDSEYKVAGVRYTLERFAADEQESFDSTLQNISDELTMCNSKK